MPLIGLALNYTPLGIRLTPVLLGLSLFAVLVTGIAEVLGFGCEGASEKIMEITGGLR